MNEENRFYETSVAEAKNKCIDKLIERCEKAKISKPIREFEIYNLDDLNHLKIIKKASYIYIFEEIDGDFEKTFANFSEYKQNTERACPALNSPSQVLYVGSSRTGIVNRLMQHKGNGTSKTYALQLDHWFMGQYKITIKEYEEASEVQIIEDALSDILKPAFGKKGSNNK